MLYTDTYQSPIGTIVMECDGAALTGLRFAESELIYSFFSADSVGKIEPQHPAASKDLFPPHAQEVFNRTRRWLDAYFNGEYMQNIPIMPRLNPAGSDFQKRVWQTLFTIPFGATATYSEIARQVGCRSPQAVGQAIGRNPIAILIPCHRVISSHGKLTGYAYGIHRKQQLLELERKYY